MRESQQRKQLRSFGLLVGSVFALIAVWPVLFRGQPLRIWAMVISVSLMVPAVGWPRVLEPFYRLWMAAGHILGWVNSRIVLGIVYFLVFTPVGLMMRLLGKDPMRLRFDSNAKTYRIRRTTRPSSHMKQQF